MTITRHHDNAPTTLDAEEIFRFLGYNPTDPAARAAVGLCMRYQLDPFAGHIIVIAGRRSPYVTRDGHLWLAHRSGQFDGMETLDEWVDEKNCHAKVAVWRKDMGHPFVYRGRCPIKNERGGWDINADKKAVANAEVRALKRAFPLQLPSIVDYEDDLETSDPGSPQPPRGQGPGSDLTSEAGEHKGRGVRHDPASDTTSPEPAARGVGRIAGSGDQSASVTGQDPPGSPNAEAPTPPVGTSPGDGKAGRERKGGRAAPGKVAASTGAPPAEPAQPDAELIPGWPE